MKAQISALENEARNILNYWLDIANSNNTKKRNGALDMLEGMVLIYNVFAIEKCEIIYNDHDELYETSFFC